MKLEHFLTSYTKINSKWIKDLHVRPDTIKPLEENIGRALYDINHSKILFDPPPREREVKTKINKVSRRKEIIKIRSEINEKEMKEKIAKINKTKSSFFEKINKIDKPLARLIKRKRKTQINKIRNEKGEVTTDTAEIGRASCRERV